MGRGNLIIIMAVSRVFSVHLPRWILAEQRLRTGRQGFSVVKVPAKKLMKKLARVPRNRKKLKF